MYSGNVSGETNRLPRFARVELLDERQRDAQLAAEEHVPQQHGADEESGRVLEEIVGRREVER